MVRKAKASDSEFHALGRLAEAVDELVTGAGRVQERLLKAAYCLVPVRPDEISDDCGNRSFAALRRLGSQIVFHRHEDAAQRERAHHFAQVVVAAAVDA
jgi:hypothetical protein